MYKKQHVVICILHHPPPCTVLPPFGPKLRGRTNKGEFICKIDQIVFSGTAAVNKKLRGGYSRGEQNGEAWYKRV